MKQSLFDLEEDFFVCLFVLVGKTKNVLYYLIVEFIAISVLCLYWSKDTQGDTKL